MNKKIEDKIIKKIYIYETERTTFEIVIKTVLISVGILFLFLSLVAAWEVMVEQQTLELITYIIYDFQNGIDNIFNIGLSLYHESPKLLILTLILLIALLFHIIFNLVRRRRYLKNKIRLIFKYWRKCR
jgi:hypothetical protein